MIHKTARGFNPVLHQGFVLYSLGEFFKQTLTDFDRPTANSLFASLFNQYMFYEFN